MGRQNRVDVGLAVQCIKFLANGITDLVDLLRLFRRNRGGLASGPIGTLNDMSAGLGKQLLLQCRSRAREWIQGLGNVLIAQERQEQVEVVDFFHLLHKLGNVLHEDLGIVIVQDVEINSVLPAGHKRRPEITLVQGISGH